MHALLLQRRIHVTRRQDAIRIRTPAQVITVNRDFGPAVRNGRRDDDDVDGIDHTLHDIVSGDHSAARWSVQYLGHIALRGGLPAVHNVTAGYESPATGN